MHNPVSITIKTSRRGRIEKKLLIRLLMKTLVMLERVVLRVRVEKRLRSVG